MAAFVKRGSLVPYGGPILRKEILTNSQATIVQDSMKIDTGNGNGFLALGTAGESVFGHVGGFATKLDVGVSTTGVSGAELGSFVGAYTSASDNETVAQVKGEVDISQFTLYSADADGTLGATTGSDQAGYTMDLISAQELDETSALATTGQYNILEVDVLDSSKVIVNIFESHVFNAKSV